MDRAMKGEIEMDNQRQMDNAYKCSECGCSLTEVYYRCYYAGDDDCNILCGEGDCWADWMQINTEEIEIEEEM